MNPNPFVALKNFTVPFMFASDVKPCHVRLPVEPVNRQHFGRLLPQLAGIRGKKAHDLVSSTYRRHGKSRRGEIDYLTNFELMARQRLPPHPFNLAPA